MAGAGAPSADGAGAPGADGAGAPGADGAGAPGAGPAGGAPEGAPGAGGRLQAKTPAVNSAMPRYASRLMTYHSHYGSVIQL